MATYPLSTHFDYFFNRLNPSPSFELQAASHYGSVKPLIEDRNGLAAALAPQSFLQGSYRQETAIHTINDIDIVVLCKLWHPGSGRGDYWSRNRIFDTIAAPLLADRRYRDKVRYNVGSMCIKVDLGIKLEILPVVYRSGNSNPSSEPFVLWRPERSQWEYGYARQHQELLTLMNTFVLTQGNFKPAIKVFKHLRSEFLLDAVSFHIECLLYRLPNRLFLGGPADYIPALLGYIAGTRADSWYRAGVLTPSGDRNIFVEDEWGLATWQAFHDKVVLWERCARLGSQTKDRDQAIEAWQLLLGKDYFPKELSS